MKFNVHDWLKVDAFTYQNRTTKLYKSKVTFSLDDQHKLGLRDYIMVKTGVLLIQNYLNDIE